MPGIPKKAVASRVQNIVGAERVIEDTQDIPLATEIKERPKFISRRLHFMPEIKAPIFSAEVIESAKRNLKGMVEGIGAAPPLPTKDEQVKTKVCPPRDYDHEGYKIETGIPMPSKDRDSRYAATIRQMVPGSFFLIPGEDKDTIASWLRALGKRQGITLITRRKFRHPKTGVLGLGIWCVEPKA